MLLVRVREELAVLVPQEDNMDFDESTAYEQFLKDLADHHKKRDGKNYVFPSGMLNTSAIAEDLIQIEPMPKDAKTYYFDENSVLHPDGFGGTDEGSHLMSQTKFTTVATRDIKEGEEIQVRTTLEGGLGVIGGFGDILGDVSGILPVPTAVDLATLIDPKGWIQLYSGRKFFPLYPKIEDIDIEDIAHSLSNQCRFSGHVKTFYSVAQHSLLVSYVVGAEYALWGLLHDASETYLIDMPKPIKRLKELDIFVQIENNIQRVICEKFGLNPSEPSVVKQMDTKMLATEARDLMSPLHPDWIQPCDPFPFTIEPLNPSDVKKLFLARYRELTEKNG